MWYLPQQLVQDFFYIKVYRRDSMDPSLSASGLCATGNLWPLLRPWSVQAEARPLPDLFHPLRSQQGWDEVKRFPSRTGRAEWSLDSWGHPTLGRAPTTLHEHGLRYSWETQVQGGAGGSKGVEGMGLQKWSLSQNPGLDNFPVVGRRVFQNARQWTHSSINMSQFLVGQKLPSIGTPLAFFGHLQHCTSVHSETL